VRITRNGEGWGGPVKPACAFASFLSLLLEWGGGACHQSSRPLKAPSIHQMTAQ
jgi:hypothetical protein